MSDQQEPGYYLETESTGPEITYKFEANEAGQEGYIVFNAGESSRLLDHQGDLAAEPGAKTYLFRTPGTGLGVGENPTVLALHTEDIINYLSQHQDVPLQGEISTRPEDPFFNILAAITSEAEHIAISNPNKAIDDLQTAQAKIQEQQRVLEHARANNYRPQRPDGTYIYSPGGERVIDTAQEEIQYQERLIDEALSAIEDSKYTIPTEAATMKALIEDPRFIALKDKKIAQLMAVDSDPSGVYSGQVTEINNMLRVLQEQITTIEGYSDDLYRRSDELAAIYEDPYIVSTKPTEPTTFEEPSFY